MIYTVFPKDGMPQDFATYEEARDYADENCQEGYEIQSTEGEIV